MSDPSAGLSTNQEADMRVVREVTLFQILISLVNHLETDRPVAVCHGVQTLTLLREMPNMTPVHIHY